MYSLCLFLEYWFGGGRDLCFGVSYDGPQILTPVTGQGSLLTVHGDHVQYQGLIEPRLAMCHCKNLTSNDIISLVLLLAYCCLAYWIILVPFSLDLLINLQSPFLLLLPFWSFHHYWITSFFVSMIFSSTNIVTHLWLPSRCASIANWCNLFLPIIWKYICNLQ